MESAERFREGQNFFNAGQYFEAHEAWEDVWRAAEVQSRKTALQGLIQAAVALHHLGRGNREGARSQLAKSIQNLGGNASAISEIDVMDLIEQLKSVQQAMRPDKVQIHSINVW